MKKTIKPTLIVILIFVILWFYNKYFSKKDLTINKKNLLIEEQFTSTNNLIKNLKYEITVQNENDYFISSELSELSSENGVEIVLMQKVIARIQGKNNDLIKISSDKARFNSNNNNTIFEKNIKIEYLDNIIFAENVELNFEQSYILVSEKVFYNGVKTNLVTDNIKIDLITKNVDIFMNNSKKNVEIELSR